MGWNYLKMNKTIYSEKIFPTLFLLFLVFINSLKIISNLILLLFFIYGLYLFLSQHGNPFKNSKIASFSFITAGYFLVMLFSLISSGMSPSELTHLSRLAHFILAPIIALAFYQLDISFSTLMKGIKVGSLMIGIISIAQYFTDFNSNLMLGKVGMVNANIFGDIAVIMFFGLLISLHSEKDLNQKIYTILLALLVLFSIYFSNSRGSWLSLLIVGSCYFLIIYKPIIKRKIKPSKILIFLVIPVAIFSLNSNIAERVKQGFNEFDNWSQGINANDSTGLRLQMWSAGLKAFQEKPLFGYGYRNANIAASKFATENKTTIRNKTHLHNQFINDMVSAGILGLFSLIILLSIPIKVFYTNIIKYKNYDSSLLGLLVGIGYLTFGFTHIAFGEENMNALYVFLMAYLFSRQEN